ncbi:helix-turn-helix transcriptional regulator [Raoultibacter phocaeensis]|uniref:helix-turn-helix transcriptional regulator n=1 Tax=Raoultibacter phocaeensis TaxID=2479841 RepID=UPI001119B909|nr:LuxR C-terminal-related transcriptional regulator [Raoultibacter phocaeensis]
MGWLSVAAILAGTGVVFVVCCAAIARASFSETLSRANLQVAVYYGAVFAVALFGCLAVTQAAGTGAAAVFSLGLCTVSLAVGWFLSRVWRRAEEAELASIDELRAFVASHQDVEATLEERCARMARECDLTRREEAILGLLLEGKTRSEIADALVVSQNTVKTHIRNLYKKMGVSGKSELAHVMGECRAETR